MLETLTGIRRSPTQVRLFLKQLGLKCLKVGLLPAKGSPEEQETYHTFLDEAAWDKKTEWVKTVLYCGLRPFM